MMKHKIDTLLASVIIIFAMSGCATIIKGSDQSFNIQSNPNQASVTITDQKSNVVVLQQDTPLIINLKKGDGYFKGKTYHVKVSKAGYKDIDFNIDNRLSGWYLGGNLLFGGIIGYFIIDPLTGAMWVLEPTQTSNVQVQDNTIIVRLLSDLNEEEKSRLIPINVK